MARDRTVYLKELSKAGSRPETKNQELLVKIHLDQLDVLDAILVKLEEVKTAIENI